MKKEAQWSVLVRTSAGRGAVARLGFLDLDDEPVNDLGGRRKPLTVTRDADRLVNHERAAVKHGFAYLKN